MKNFNSMKIIIFIILTQFIFAAFAETSASSQEVNFRNSKPEKSDSLPPGVTQEWLKSLTDESRNKIIPENELHRTQTIDPEGDAMQQNVFNGYASGNLFGNSVSSAGDVNGDGFDDLIVGAYQYDTAGVQTGRAYIFFGGTTINSEPDVILKGESFYNRFGISVSKAGDFNNDGFDDVIVGTRTFTPTGKAYIFFGGSSMDNLADVVIENTGSSDVAFGSCVSDGGDINNDGYDDVIVGSYGNVFIYLGNSMNENTADFILTAENSNDAFGSSVSKAGDVNGDGYTDVVIGAPGYNSNRGKAYIYLGGVLMDNISDLEINRSDSSYYFATSVSDAGDVNGDGYGDVIISAVTYNSSTGRSYIYFGGVVLNNIPDVTLTGENTNNFFGHSLSEAGDVNGDGYDDVIVGADGYNTNTGKAYVYFGGISMNNNADLFMTDENTSQYYGYSVVGAGDMNGDGYDDLTVGSPFFNSNTGRVYVYTNTMTGTDISDVTLSDGSYYNYYGYSVSDAGDVNGDGYSDVIVGSPNFNSRTGRAYIYFGGVLMNNVADVILNGESVEHFFGVCVSGAGDVNHDGFSDVIVGAATNFGSPGRVYVFLGGAAMNNTADVTINGAGGSNTAFGFSISNAGDVNADGFSDIIVGDYNYNNSKGRALIYFGGSSMNSTADVLMNGESDFNGFGGSVSDAGDVNCDGYSDVIVGAYQFNSYTGRAYVFFGGSSMNNVADVVMNGEASSNNFGLPVSGAGDVNGDGCSDVAIGAYGYNSHTGRVYIYYGGASMNNVVDLTITGVASSDFGHSISCAGDVNSDGFSDIIIGTYGNIVSDKAYVYFGSEAMDNSADLILDGGITGYEYGYTLSNAGDVNGDGISDLIVGDLSSNGIGKAYIYFSSPTSVKPILNYVKDVPNDEGHFVKLKWARSGYDVPDINTISDYVVYRSTPPNVLFYNWVEQTVINSSNQSFYYYIDNTPYDSTSDSSARFFYRIKARNNVTGEFWYSDILSGNSYDNNAPEKVEPFTSEDESSDARLNWQRSTAPDFKNYLLYRSTASYIDPETETVFHVSTDTTFLDNSPLSGFYKYFIVAVDSNNHKSPVAIVENPFYKRTFLFGSIQGLYDPFTDIEIYDTVTVYLRNGVAPYEIVDSAKDILYGPLTGQDFLFENAENNVPYYIVVKHRNALETWSADPISMVIGENTIAFSVNSIYAYGNNEIQVDASPYNVFAFYSGDINQDETIDASDLSGVENDVSNSVSGYVPTDLNGDDFVDAGDLSIVENNVALGVTAVTP